MEIGKNKLMIALMLVFSVQVSHAEAGINLGDIFLGIAEVLTEEKCLLVNGNIAQNGTPTRIAGHNVSPNSLVGKLRFEFLQPSEVIVTVKGYIPYMVHNYVYQNGGQELAYLPSYKDTENTFAAVLPPGKYYIESTTSKTGYSSDVNTEISVNVKPIEADSWYNQDDEFQFLYVNKPVQDYIPFYIKGKKVDRAYVFDMTYDGDITLEAVSNSKSCDLIFYLISVETRELIEKWDVIFNDSQRKVFHITKGRYLLFVEPQYKGGGAYSLTLR